ncbi:putative 2-aminoethylphosphonate ABC transporter ATP-binding protein [Marinobacterium sp. YM272]|uniref:putative 2-aminoethylphosphonate ABC transporter ATP-binding protein n=1 Tax=Marinobacterium sp. YM272 TaxID=3421654 RepID=UPI003D7F7C10
MSEARRASVSTEPHNSQPAAAKVVSHAASKTAPYLQVHDLSKKYGDFVALNQVSLNVSEGEFICFLGPSGCGKTTLLRAIAGLEFQTAGSIIQDGLDVSWLPPNKRDFGIVFQSYALFPNLTVAQNIAFGLQNLGVAKQEIGVTVAKLLDNIGLPDAGNKYPGQLSGGQQQRVALARALATSPSLLLLDEPLSALDAQVRVHLRQEIKQLQHQLGVTTIMVTHDQEEAMSMADRIVVMNHGHIEQIGTPQEIYQNPASVFVARFVGTINLIPCRVSGPERVELNGMQFHVPTTNHLLRHEGQLAIRPEDIELVEDDSSEANLLRAEVESVEFLGSFARIELRGDNALRLTVDLSMRQIRSRQIGAGTALTLRLPPASVHLFNTDSATA